jgi:hypothetical protein
MKKLASLCAMLAISAAPAFAASDAGPMSGDRPTLGRGAEYAVCLPTRAQLNAVQDAVAAGDRDGFKEIIQNGFMLHPGAKVLVLTREGFPLFADMRIRILTGPHAHEACWTQADVKDLFV